MSRLTAALLATLLCLPPAQGLAAEERHEHHPPAEAAAPAKAPAPAPSADAPPPAASQVGITEKLGDILPLDLVLTGEDGSPVVLRDLFTIPTLVAPVYYSCPTDCNFLLGALARILPQVGLTPGKDYQLVAVSFDENDTPAVARHKKSEFLTALGQPFPPEAWRFLTGDPATVKRLMDALGFGFAREGGAFRHPVATIAVSPQGRITRYLHGGRPLPFDIALAATEAADEKVGFSVKRAVALCYSYDPGSRRYVFDVMRVAGASVLFAIGLFALFLIMGGKKPRR